MNLKFESQHGVICSVNSKAVFGHCVINPDAHDVEELQELGSAFGSARKGWLTCDDVVNTLPLGEIERELERKGSR